MTFSSKQSISFGWFWYLVHIVKNFMRVNLIGCVHAMDMFVSYNVEYELSWQDISVDVTSNWRHGKCFGLLGVLVTFLNWFVFSALYSCRWSYAPHACVWLCLDLTVSYLQLYRMHYGSIYLILLLSMTWTGLYTISSIQYHLRSRQQSILYESMSFHNAI